MRVTTPCPNAEVLQRLLLGDLAPHDLDPLSEHVLHCDRCADSLNGLRPDDPLLQTLRGGDTTTPIPALVQALISRLAHAPTAMPTNTLEATAAESSAAATGTAAASAVLRPPQTPGELGRLGGYRVLKLLGQGGMGSVFLAEDVQLERPIALKVMAPALAAKPEARQRFLREARATAKLKDDHVVAIYQVGEDNGIPFLAMEYLQGESLDAFLHRGGQLSPAQLLRVARDVTRGLAAAHAKGLVHRDIKPANLWLEAPQGRAKILDFGLARGGADDVQLTQTGTILGTPAYMSPEQGRGEPADARSDLFSLGCVLYRLCTGKPPFEGPTVMSILTSLATHDPTPVGQINREVPAALADLVMRLLAKRSSGRPETAQAVLRELDAIEEQLQRDAQKQALGNSSATTVARTNPAVGIDNKTECVPHDPQHVSAPRRPKVRKLALVGAGVLAALAAILLGAGIIRIETNKGTLVIEGADDDVEVIVKQNGAVIRDKVKAREIELKVGDYTIELAEKGDGLRLNTDNFTITRGEKTPIKVYLEKPMAKKDTPAVGDDPDRQVAEWVIKKGGRVAFVNVGAISTLPLPPGDLRISLIDLTGSKEVTDDDLRSLKALKTPFILCLYDCKKITDAGIQNLKNCQALRGLIITYTAATPACMEAIIAAHPLLERLDCPFGMSDADLVKLTALKKLTRLSAPNSTITDEGVSALTQLPQLTGLSLHFPKSVTDRGVHDLAKMKQLQYIEFKGTAITDMGWQELAKLPNLQQVLLTDMGYSEKMLRALAANPTLIRIWGYDDGSHLDLFKNHPSLSVLELTTPNVDDKCIETVITLKKLQSLQIKGSKITRAGVEKLKAALPQCAIDSDFGLYERGKPAAAWQPIPVGQSPFDKLDPNAIPKAERFDWQPKELVGIIGSHRGNSGGYGAGPIIFSPDGRWLVRGNSPERLWIWDAKTLVLRYTQLPALGRPFFSADGKTMAVATIDEQGHAVVDLIDLSGETPKRAKRQILAVGDGVSAVALLPDGKSIATGGANGRFSVHDLDDAEGKPQIQLREPTNSGSAPSYDIMVSPDGKRIGAICAEPPETKPGEFVVRFWDISEAKPKELFSLPFKVHGMLSALLSPDGKTLFVGGSFNNWLEAYDVTGVQPKLLDRVQLGPAEVGWCNLAGFVKGGGGVGLLRNMGLELWEVADGKLKKGKELPKNAVACNDDLSRIIVGGEGIFSNVWEIHLCDSAGKKLVEGAHPTVDPGEELGLPFAAGGRMFTTTVPFRSWEVKDGGWSVVQQSKDYAHGFHGYSQTVSPDEKLVAARVHQGIRIAEVQDLFAHKWDEVGPTVPFRNNISAPFCWGADSKTLFIAQADGAIEAWDVAKRTPQSRVVWKGDGPWNWQTATTDGRHLACIDQQRKLFVIDAVGNSPAVELPLPADEGAFMLGRFTPEGSGLLAATNSGKVYRYPLGQPPAKPTAILEPSQGTLNFELSRDGKLFVWTDGHRLCWYDATTTPLQKLGEWKLFAATKDFQITPDCRHILLEQAGMIYVLRIAGR